MKAATMANVTSSAVRTLSNTEANEAPAVAPTIAGIAKPASRQGSSRRGGISTAVAQPTTIGSRLEALATTGSTPMAIAIGRITADPLEATVFRNAPATPARIRISVGHGAARWAEGTSLLTQRSETGGFPIGATASGSCSARRLTVSRRCRRRCARPLGERVLQGVRDADPGHLGGMFERLTTSVGTEVCTLERCGSAFAGGSVWRRACWVTVASMVATQGGDPSSSRARSSRPIRSTSAAPVVVTVAERNLPVRSAIRRSPRPVPALRCGRGRRTHPPPAEQDVARVGRGCARGSAATP